MENAPKLNRVPTTDLHAREHGDDPVSVAPVGRLRRARYLLPTIHAGLFLAMLAAQHLPGPPIGLFIDIPLVVDLPLSYFAFGIIFQGAVLKGLVLWGVGGTLWWYLLGAAVDAVIRWRSRVSA